MRRTRRQQSTDSKLFIQTLQISYGLIEGTLSAFHGFSGARNALANFMRHRPGDADTAARACMQVAPDRRSARMTGDNSLYDTGLFSVNHNLSFV